MSALPPQGRDADIERAARSALKAGKLGEAFEHASTLLVREPNSRAYQQLVEQIVRTAGDPAELFELGPTTSPAVVAVAAYVTAFDGDVGQALSLLMQAASARPELACGEWLSRWFPDDAALRQVPAAAIGSGLLAWAKRSFARDSLEPAEHAAFDRFRPLVEKLCRIHQHDPQLQVLASTLLRKVGKKKGALLLAERALKLSPCAPAHVAVGLAHRALGDRASAIRSLRAALKASPTEDGVLMADLGDLYLELGETGPATTWYERARERGSIAYAEAGLCAVRHREGAEGPWLQRLHELAAHTGLLGHRARQLIAAVGGVAPTTPFVDFIPQPTEAAYNTLRSVIERTRAGESVRVVSMATSNLEAPSVWLAFDLFYASRGSTERASPLPPPDTDVRGVGRPTKLVEFLLWRYEEGLPRPAVAGPRPEVASAVQSLAETPFHVDAWFDAAADVAATLDPGAAPDLLGCMVHPRPLTTGSEPGLWVRAQQHAAALILARLGAEDWTGSLRRRVLHDLVFGPLDWSVEAAIVAAARLARHEPAAATEIATWLTELALDLPTCTPVPYASALALCGLRLPGLTAEQKATFEALRASLVQRERPC